MYQSVNSLLLTHIDEVATIYPFDEAREIVYRLAESVLACSRAKLLLLRNELASPEFDDELNRRVLRILQSEPLQYVIGEVEFYGCSLKVNSSVLIPRPETEELVDIIVKEWKGKSPEVIDFGTGSGCISISIAKNIPSSSVTSVDVSLEALKVAEVNAIRNSVHVNFIKEDMRIYTSNVKYDIIVSNPPYVMNSEAAMMRPNVLNFEPHLALFVDDTDPLEFYKTIAKFSSDALSYNGIVYLEINQQLGVETANLFTRIGMNCEIVKDLFNVDRFVIAKWAKR